MPSPSRTGRICWERSRCSRLLPGGAVAWSQTPSKAGWLMERVRMRLPLIGETITKFQFAQFCRTLSTLLAGGTPLVQAMETAGGAIQQPPGFRRDYCRARNWFAKGNRCTAPGLHGTGAGPGAGNDGGGRGQRSAGPHAGQRCGILRRRCEHPADESGGS